MCDAHLKKGVFILHHQAVKESKFSHNQMYQYTKSFKDIHGSYYTRLCLISFVMPLI